MPLTHHIARRGVTSVLQRKVTRSAVSALASVSPNKNSTARFHSRPGAALLHALRRLIGFIAGREIEPRFQEMSLGLKRTGVRQILDLAEAEGGDSPSPCKFVFGLGGVFEAEPFLVGVADLSKSRGLTIGSHAPAANSATGARAFEVGY